MKAYSEIYVPRRFLLLIQRYSTESSLHWRVKDLNQEHLWKTLSLGKAYTTSKEASKNCSRGNLSASFSMYWENKPTLKAKWWKVSFRTPSSRRWIVGCSELKKKFRTVYQLAKFVLLCCWRGINPKYDLLAIAEMRYDRKESVNTIHALKSNLISSAFLAIQSRISEFMRTCLNWRTQGEYPEFFILPMLNNKNKIPNNKTNNKTPKPRESPKASSRRLQRVNYLDLMLCKRKT